MPPQAHVHAGLPCGEAAGGACTAVAGIGAGGGVGLAAGAEDELVIPALGQ